jgi:hypothetical protein
VAFKGGKLVVQLFPRHQARFETKQSWAEAVAVPDQLKALPHVPFGGYELGEPGPEP